MNDEMIKYASQMEFEKAAELRDKIKELQNYVEDKQLDITVKE